MLARLEAEETMAAATAAALGAGMLKRNDAARLWRRLERAARGADARPARADRRVLAMMGIEVVDG